MVSSPLKPPKQINSFKTKEIKVENNRVFSFGQFGKIELEAINKTRPGYQAGPSHLTHTKRLRSESNPSLLKNLSKTAREWAKS
jgi:hypothetical protein